MNIGTGRPIRTRPNRTSPPQPSPPRAEPATPTALRQWLMTGVTYMIPFVVTGGVLIAAAYLLGGAEIASKVTGGTLHGVAYPPLRSPAGLVEQAGYAGLLYQVGATALSMLVPMLAAFIAYAMAGPLALVAGVVAGLLAAAGGAGYLRGLLGGLLAGAVVRLLSRTGAPRALAGLLTVVGVPLLSTLVVGVAVLVVIGPPVAAVQRQLTGALTTLSSSNAVLLGLVLGLMVAFDLGGPVNKVAYTFGLAALAHGDPRIAVAGALSMAADATSLARTAESG